MVGGSRAIDAGPTHRRNSRRGTRCSFQRCRTGRRRNYAVFGGDCIIGCCHGCRSRTRSKALLEHFGNLRRLPTALCCACSIDPFRRRLDLSRRRAARVLPAAALQSANCAYAHIVIAEDLAAKSDAREAARSQHVALGDRHLGWLTADEFNPTRRTARVPGTRMQLIDARVLLEREYESFAAR